MNKLDRLAICMMLIGIFLRVQDDLHEYHLWIALSAFMIGFVMLFMGVFETDNN